MAESQPLSIKAFRLGSQQTIGHSVQSTEHRAQSRRRGAVAREQPAGSAHMPKPLRAGLKGRSIKSVKDGEFTISVSLGNQS